MKDFLVTVHNGGDEAVAAVQRMGDDWRAMLEQAAAEVESLRLTEEEREAVEVVLRMCGDPSPATAPLVLKYAATLRGLLERLGGER